MKECLQRPNQDVLPATLSAVGPSFATVNLYGDAAFGTELVKDAFLVILGRRGRLAVELTDLQSVDPRRDLRKLALNAHFGGVPIVQLPGLDPFLRRA